MTFTAGTKLGAFEIVGLLGEGGMGQVYRNRHSYVVSVEGLDGPAIKK